MHGAFTTVTVSSRVVPQIKYPALLATRVQVDRGCFRYGRRRFDDEPFSYRSVPCKVPHNSPSCNPPIDIPENFRVTFSIILVDGQQHIRQSSL